MKNKGLIIFLTTIVSLLCLYYLSFSVIDANVQRKATQYATSQNGNLDFLKKQAYLDDVWKKPVLNLFGLTYTYEEVKENALNLGLDLQGGMHVTLEVSPVELIQGLSGNSKDEKFLAAIKMAEQKQHTKASLPFTKLFYQAYKEIYPEGKLSDIFATAANRNRITRHASDQEILKYLDTEIEHAIDRAFEIIRSRIDRFGTSQPNIQRLQGTGKIQIELPGVNNPERVRKLLQGVAQLRFWKVYELSQIDKTLQAVNSLLVAEEKGKAKVEPTKPSDNANNSAAKELAAQLEQGISTPKEQDENIISPLYKLLKLEPVHGLTYSVEDIHIIQQILERPDVKLLFPKDLMWLWDVKPHKLENGTEVLSVHPIQIGKNNLPLLEGDVITDARQVFDKYGKPAVSMQMNGQGAKLWKNITASNIGRSIAITLDNKVYSAPTVNTEIPDGNSQITGNFSIEEAKDLANILKAGSLPAPVKITEEAIIGPTLSKTAQAQGITSMALGLAVVVLFMLLYYAKGGIVANLALLFNILFILGILAQFNAALTLSGIAGIVLTIGMSIDANVLIFERIREELRRGNKMREAINKGYQKAYSSIIDSNVTTFLTSAILYGLGQGPVRGFATTLMIGIVTSFFTAVFITRLIFTWWAKHSKEDNISFSFVFNKNVLTNCRIDFIGKRKLFYVASSLFIAIGLLLIVKQGGLNLGVDFTGGRSYVINFSEPVETALLKAKLAEQLGDQSTEVKSYGANNVVKITTSYLIQETSSEAEEKAKNTLVRSIQESTKFSYTDDVTGAKNPSFAIVSISKVGPSIAGDIQASAKKSIIFSLLIIFGYIVIRFRRWQFGLSAVIALLHDSLTVFATFAIARAFGYAYEIDQVFIAAILSIIGYSINDTVVIFDRIREMQRLHPNENFTSIANKSINDTLSRTLITSFTTLVAVFILFVWGGEVLRGFSFALLVGITFGSYSSICIAAPLILDFSKKNYQKRIINKDTNPYVKR
ncbi:MAG: protein translocase subunit SecDF [Candidatus Amoebophilus sp.]